MINTPQNILLLALIVLVGGAVFQSNATFQSNAVNTSQSLIKCQNTLNISITDDFTDNDPWLLNSTDSNPTEKQPKTVSSCNSFSPVVVTTNRFSLEPDEQNFNIRNYNTILSSQIFVFQEPDPPRLG